MLGYSELFFYRKEIPLRRSKSYIHAREVLNSPRQALESQRLTLSWRLLNIALSLKNECPQKPNNSTSYTITLLLPEIGQEKIGFRHSRKEYCIRKNFHRRWRKEMPGGEIQVTGEGLSPQQTVKYILPSICIPHLYIHMSKLHFIYVCVSFRSES